MLAADALALLEHLALGPVDVLGLSLGGLVAQELALLAPLEVRSLVLAASAARLPGEGPVTHLCFARDCAFVPSGSMPMRSSPGSMTTRRTRAW